MWVGSSCCDCSVHSLVAVAGSLCGSGWSTKASDSACVEFVRAFYLGLVRYGFTYPRAFDFARDEFARLG